MKALFIILITISFLHCAKNVKKPLDTTIPDKNQKNEYVNASDNVIPEKHIGTYQIEIGGFKGILELKKKNNHAYGSIAFQNWGNGKPFKLKMLRINGQKIFFIRSVETPEEKIEYNSNRVFKQSFYGIFSADGKSINGKYIDLGDESFWNAKKIDK